MLPTSIWRPRLSKTFVQEQKITLAEPHHLFFGLTDQSPLAIKGGGGSSRKIHLATLC